VATSCCPCGRTSRSACLHDSGPCGRTWCIRRGARRACLRCHGRRDKCGAWATERNRAVGLWARLRPAQSDRPFCAPFGSLCEMIIVGGNFEHCLLGRFVVHLIREGACFFCALPPMLRIVDEGCCHGRNRVRSRNMPLGLRAKFRERGPHSVNPRCPGEARWCAIRRLHLTCSANPTHKRPDPPFARRAGTCRNASGEGVMADTTLSKKLTASPPGRCVRTNQGSYHGRR
jgi:hypothetical protein